MGQALLGRDTAIALGVLKWLGSQVNSLEVQMMDGGKGISSVLEKFPGCCEDIAKLKDFQLKILVDPEVQSVAQPIIRAPT